MERIDEHGDDVQDALHSRCPTKITKVKKKKVLGIVDENPRLTF